MYDVTTAKLFLLDMDGTFYLDDTLLPGALEFLALCRATGRQFAFLTNNSSKSKADYLAKLTRLGADVTEHDIFTSGDATLLYLAENGFPKDILLIGTPSLEAQFAAEGYTVRAAKPRAVVLGFDTTITYNKLRLLCDAVRAGLPYIATHPDYNCPVAGGFIPDIGAVIAFVKASTGRDPDAVIGKPNAYIARAAAHKYRCDHRKNADQRRHPKRSSSMRHFDPSILIQKAFPAEPLIHPKHPHGTGRHIGNL